METEKKKTKEKKANNNYTFKAVGWTLGTLVLCVGIFLLADVLFPFKGLGSREEFRDLQMNLSVLIGTLSTIMVLVCAYLVYIYSRDYLELRSKFTLGVLSAVVALMIFALTVNPFFHFFFGIMGNPGVFTLIPYFFATAALVILAWVSSR